MQQKIQNYDELFKRFEQDAKTGSESNLNKPQQYGRQRREISEQLELTPELICRQIERIYRRNIASSSSSFITPETSILSSSSLSSSTDILSHQHDITYDRLQNNIQRLMKNHTSKQYFSLIEDILKKEIERNNNTIHQFNMKMDEYKKENNNNHDDDVDEDKKMENLTDEQKLEAISRQQNERLQYIIQLEQDAERWKNRTKILEQQLCVETQQKYSDPDVQAAHM